jgi:hypothetical protein
LDEDYQNLEIFTKEDLIDIARHINKIAIYANSPHTDGFSACSCKHDLYILKCLLEDVYKTLPDFPQQEKEWEQKRLMEILRK